MPPGGDIDTVAAGFGIVIPARYASSRLPGKPLLPLAGKPMIVRVWENACRVGAAFVWVATDDERIAQAVQAAGGEVVMTRGDHESGTDRLAEVVEKKSLADDTIVVNVQGDEPLLEAEFVRSVADALLARPFAGIATLATPVRTAAELFDPNVVKVVTDARGMALTFSRAPMPWVRDTFRPGVITETLPTSHTFLRHVGLYAYTSGTLRKLAATAPVSLERMESLEQLRALWLGIPIHVSITDQPPGYGVDTAEDLARAEALLLARGATLREGI